MAWRDLLPWGKKSGSTMDLLREVFFQQNQSSTGKTVNSETALKVSTVFACCRVIGEGLAQVPLKLMKESGNTRVPYKDHPLYGVLATKPNSWQTSFEYREMLAWHVVLAGSHYSFKNKNSKGQVIELIPFSPNQVTVKQLNNYDLKYEVRADDGSTKLFDSDQIWHVRGPSWNGWQGLDAVKLAREAIGLAMATEEASGRLQKNGVRPSGMYSVEGTLTADKYKELVQWIENNFGGVANSGKPMIMDRAAKWVNTQMSGIDAQSLETRRFQIEEICRFARVMPIMVGYSDKAATYASAEQMFLAHVVHTLAPWFTRLEQSIDVNLLSDKDRSGGIYANFVEEGLLRGASTDTKDVLLGYVNGGLMTPNEGRAKLDLNPIDDEEANKLRIPANIVGAGQEQGAANAAQNA